MDLHKSLQPFLIVYNREEKSVQSTGYVNGQVPPLPQGVLGFTRQHHEDCITWQPAPGIRIAAVVVSYGGNGGGYVLASRSLRVVEERESSLFNTVGHSLFERSVALGGHPRRVVAQGQKDPCGAVRRLTAG
ncbi:hypothetical protein [Alicyclobacillus kakegawensis]|uniref:hypothetical protein n=1 Tax=Alicyclobacillus kakegawensis TaxID=392012 RepID=UPI0008372874|nr:hypothetical protein [Alicyclobacillus kakegawensis]